MVYSHDLFVSLIEAIEWDFPSALVSNYSHDLFVSLIEANASYSASRAALLLFSRSIREPHWSNGIYRKNEQNQMVYSHDLFVSLIEAVEFGCLWAYRRTYSHDLFVSLIEAHYKLLQSEGLSNYSHDLFVSLIEACWFSWLYSPSVALFSRSIREPHWSRASLSPSGLHPHNLFSRSIREPHWSLAVCLFGAGFSSLFSRSIREPHWSYFKQCSRCFRLCSYSHDLFVSLIEAEINPVHDSCILIYSHDLFVSLIEAARMSPDRLWLFRLFSRSIREPHWSRRRRGWIPRSFHPLFSRSIREPHWSQQYLAIKIREVQPILTIYSWASLKQIGLAPNLRRILLFSRSIREPHWSGSEESQQLTYMNLFSRSIREPHWSQGFSPRIIKG